MTDKTFLLIIIVFIALGIYSYQNAIREHGGITPLHELIDMGGLKKTSKNEGIQVSSQIYTFDMQQNLSRLNNKLKLIEGQRNQLLFKREQILQKLMALNGELELQASEFAAIIKSEFELLENDLSVLESYENEILDLIQQTDLNERKIIFDDIHSRMLEHIGTIVKNPDQELIDINKMLQEIDLMFQGKANLEVWGCADAISCIEDNLNAIRGNINGYIDREIIEPSQKMDNMKELSELLDYQFRFLKSNTAATDLKIRENNQVINEKMNDLVADLVEVTAEDFKKIIKLFDELETEQRIYLSNLDNQHKILTQRLIGAQKAMIAMTEHLETMGHFRFDAIINSYRSLKEKQDVQIKRLGESTNEFVMLNHQYLEENKGYFDKLSQYMKVDLDLLRKEIEIAVSGASKSTATVRRPSSPRQVEQNVPKPPEIKPASVNQGGLQIDTDYQMKLMRQKMEEDTQKLDELLKTYGQ